MQSSWLDFDNFKRRFMKVYVDEFPNMTKLITPSPQVTVHIVTYNHVNFIRDAVEGVLMQKTTFPFEVIMGDDDSTDGTREICIEYAKKYPQLIRLMLHKRENNIKVLGKACLIFQYLFNSFSARGKYIAVCSGDDYWTDPQKLQKQYDFLQANPHINRTTTDHVITYTSSTAKSRDDEKGEGAASTWMYKNIFTRIPIEYTQVIAEDSFLDFYLSAIGDKAKTEKLKPVVIRRHDSNVFMTEDNKVMELQRANTIDRCVSALRIFKNNKKFKLKLITKLVDKNLRLRSVYGLSKLKLGRLLIKDFFRYRLLIDFFVYLLFYRFLRLKIYN
jgi:glycosyltransferase involved in cell wall biosynthesis